MNFAFAAGQRVVEGILYVESTFDFEEGGMTLSTS